LTVSVAALEMVTAHSVVVLEMADLGFSGSTPPRALSKKPNEIGPNLNFYRPTVAAAEIRKKRFGSIFGSKSGSLKKHGV
jgi:hypothetical protein